MNVKNKMAISGREQYLKFKDVIFLDKFMRQNQEDTVENDPDFYKKNNQKLFCQCLKDRIHE